MREPYWWEKKEPEEPEELKETHFLDSLVEEIKIKPEEEPYFLDEVVKGIAKPELEPDILDETIRTIETEEKEKTGYWWLDTWQKGQEAYTWLYPGGYGKALVNNWQPVLEATSYAMGDAATFLARLCPNQEDLPPWREQALPRQALTLGQATSVVVLAGLIGYTGVTAIASLGKFLIHGRADKIAAKFATQHFDKIKKLNPEVKTLEDAQALSQASLRGVIRPYIDPTAIQRTMAGMKPTEAWTKARGLPGPTVQQWTFTEAMSKLKGLGNRLLTALPKEAPTAQFKTAMVEQVKNILTQGGAEPTAKMLEPFSQILDHFVGSPVSGIVSKEYGVAIVDVVNKNLPAMIEQIMDTGKATLPFEKPIIPEGKVVEDVEEIVDMAMRDKPLTEEQIFTEAREAYVLLDKFTKGDEADKASQLFPEEEIAPTKQMGMYQQELKRLQEAGITGKEAEKAALETAGLKYKPKEIRPPAEQLKWELGKPTIKGQRELELKPQPGTPGYIEWWKKLPQDKQDAELLRKQTPEIERLITGELEEMRAEVEEGIPGRRIRTEEGEWMGQPSTYPDFMGEFGLTKKQVLKAYEDKKGTWDLLQDIARDRVAMGYEHPKLGMIEPMVSKAESDYLIQMREISEEIPEKIIVNEHLGIAEARLENTPGQPITEKDYAKLAGKYDGQTKALDLTEFDKETIWWQGVDKELNSPLNKEQLAELETRMDGLKIVEDERGYFIRSMTSNRTNKLSELTQEEAILMNNYLAGLPKYDPDVPIPTINPPESTPGQPDNFRAGLLSSIQNMESFAERMESKYPKTKMFTNILYPTIQARRRLYQLRIRLAKKGLEAIKGLTKDEMREIQDWAEEERKGIKHTITLSERQEATRAELLKGINEVADLVEVAEEERVPGKGYMPRRYRKEFLERLGIRKRTYDFSPMPWDYLRTPKSFKPFFKYERTIEDAPKNARLDLFSSYMQYVNQGAKAHFRDVLEDTAPDIDKLPPKLRAYMRRWANLQGGVSGIGEQLWVNTLGEVGVKRERALMIERYLMDAGYMGGLGLKVSFAGKNATQFLHALSEIPEQWVLYGLYKMFTKEGKEIWQKSGCQMHYGPYLSRNLPKAKGRYQKAKNGMMIFVQLSDQMNREPAYLADYFRTLHYGKLYQEGRMNWTDLTRKLDLKRYEEPFQDIIKRHLEKGEIEVASDLLGDRVQAFTNWRYWGLTSPMLLQEGGPFFRQFSQWGFSNADLLWARRIERGTKLIKQGEVKAGSYQFGKILRHLFYIGVLGAAIREGAKRITGKEYEVGPLTMARYLIFGSIPSGLAPVPGAVANAFQFAVHSLSTRDWLAAQKKRELKRSLKVFIPAGLSFKDWWAALEKGKPGEALMRIVYPQFREKPEEKKRGWYEPAKREKKEEKRGWYESPGREEEGEKKGWWE